MTRRSMRGLASFAAVAAVVGMVMTLHAAPQDSTAGQGRPNAGPNGDRPRAGRRPDRRSTGMAANRLGLTDAQKQQMKSIRQSHREELRALAERLATARTSLRDAMTADSVDEAAIRQRNADFAAVQADIDVARARERADMYQVLTPDQQAQAKALQNRARGRASARQRRWSKRRGL